MDRSIKAQTVVKDFIVTETENMFWSPQMQFTWLVCD